MHEKAKLSGSDVLIIRSLVDHPRATATGIAEETGLARSTVHARLNQLEGGVLDSFEHRVSPAALGLHLTAYVFAHVAQHRLSELPETLSRIPEIIEVNGVSGDWDLIIRVAAIDADDLYRVADLILSTQGIERTSTTLVMRSLVPRRVTPLIDRLLVREPGR